ncbi:hypothetical protein GCM10027321_47090 [Massilia terrae]
MESKDALSRSTCPAPAIRMAAAIPAPERASLTNSQPPCAAQRRNHPTTRPNRRSTRNPNERVGICWPGVPA